MNHSTCGSRAPIVLFPLVTAFDLHKFKNELARAGPDAWLLILICKCWTKNSNVFIFWPKTSHLPCTILALCPPTNGRWSYFCYERFIGLFLQTFFEPKLCAFENSGKVTSSSVLFGSNFCAESHSTRRPWVPIIPVLVRLRILRRITQTSSIVSLAFKKLNCELARIAWTHADKWAFANFGFQ